MPRERTRAPLPGSPALRLLCREHSVCASGTRSPVSGACSAVQCSAEQSQPPDCLAVPAACGGEFAQAAATLTPNQGALVTSLTPPDLREGLPKASQLKPQRLALLNSSRLGCLPLYNLKEGNMAKSAE